MPDILSGGTGGVKSLMGQGGGVAEFMLEGTIARTDTVAKNLFLLPLGAVVLRVEIGGLVASDAGTTATINVGKTGTDNFFVNAADVKTAGLGDASNAKATKNAVALAAGIQVVGKYAETGGASTTGGPWNVRVYYKIPGV